MKKAHPQGRARPQWYKGEFHRFYTGLPLERKKADEARLDLIFEVGEAVPVFKQALDWARAHDIDIFIDHTTRTAKGYYQPGTGVVALSSRCAGTVHEALSVLTHEIRHAWQDYYGLIPRRCSDLTTHYTRIAMIEADAYAFQNLATEQYMDIFNNPYWDDKKSPHAATPAQEEKILQRYFERWFNGERALTYGNIVMQRRGEDLGIPGLRDPIADIEFRPKWRYPQRQEPDYNRRETRELLGKTFANRNYIAHGLKQEFNEVFTRRYLAPSAAAAFYQRNKQPARHKGWVREIRIAEMRKKHAGKRKAGAGISP